MAFGRTLAQRLFSATRKSNATMSNCRISSSAVAVKTSSIPQSPAGAAPDPGDDGVMRRLIQRRPMHKSAGVDTALRYFPMGANLLEKLREIDISRDRIRLDGLIPPPAVAESPEVGKLTVEDARKILRVSQLEAVKAKLRQISRDHIAFPEFLQICSEESSNSDLGLEFAKTLDQSGSVIVLGNIVFLKPDQVVKVIRGLMPSPVAQPGDWRWKQLGEMEKQKAIIDTKAESLVRRELWCGLGYLVIQTAAFMRLTFWELSWDVMEPICFYVTSIYFMAGYAFFLRTSKEPSFEGFFQSRFSAKQKKLMKADGFDLAKYNELKKACYPESSLSTPSFDASETSQAYALH